MYVTFVLLNFIVGLVSFVCLLERAASTSFYEGLNGLVVALCG